MIKRILAMLAAATLLLSGCTQPQRQEVRPIQSPTPVLGFEQYYQQQLEFESCGKRLYCSEVLVPMKWDDPLSEPISIAIIYREAENNNAEFLLFNPGGPGSSGYDWLLDSAEYLGTAKLRKNFNIMGFDPRGVGRSSAVKCLTDSELDDFLYGVSGYPIFSPPDIESGKAEISKFAQKCMENTGELLGFIDTVSAAKDMDVLRAVVGSTKLNYLGYSYGSFLGTSYATLFPERVGRMVLDGGIDPTAPDQEQTRFQIEAFESSLRSFLANCEQFRDCPFSGDVESDLRTIQVFLERLEKQSLKTSSGRELTIWAAITGLIMPLYSESYWSVLSTAFAEAFEGTGDTFLSLADFYNDRSDDGSYKSNLIAANYAINCLDSRSDSSMSAMLAENNMLIRVAPTLGKYWQYGALRCDSWPYPVKDKLKDYSATGSETIVVIGTTGDPATPYSQSVALATKILANGFLFTYNGEGHTVYGQQVRCIDDAVDRFFILGELPNEDPNCKA